MLNFLKNSKQKEKIVYFVGKYILIFFIYNGKWKIKSWEKKLQRNEEGVEKNKCYFIKFIEPISSLIAKVMSIARLCSSLLKLTPNYSIVLFEFSPQFTNTHKHTHITANFKCCCWAMKWRVSWHGVGKFNFNST